MNFLEPLQLDYINVLLKMPMKIFHTANMPDNALYFACVKPTFKICTLYGKQLIELAV